MDWRLGAVLAPVACNNAGTGAFDFTDHPLRQWRALMVDDADRVPFQGLPDADKRRRVSPFRGQGNRPTLVLERTLVDAVDPNRVGRNGDGEGRLGESIHREEAAGREAVRTEGREEVTDSSRQHRFGAAERNSPRRQVKVVERASSRYPRAELERRRGCGRDGAAKTRDEPQPVLDRVADKIGRVG